MKSIIFIFALLLIFSCSQKNKNSISKKDSTVVAIDSVAVNIDSSKIENLKQESIPDEEPKDGKYSQIIKDKDISAEIFYTIKEGRVDYYKLKVYQHKKIQNLDAVSDWEFKNVEELDFKFEDVNFDGINDLTISKEVGMNWFKLNVWINKKGKFIQEKKFDDIYSPIFDPKSKEIKSYYRVSSVGEFWSTYQWKNNKLIRTSYTEDIIE
ncbi:XAC2610-related protein [Chryseobacterium zhengzhouense]|uniref:XAC2610-related protein n=1 Tax=Chryseobacterium zhengzhouense TaxID=1636086 RepID=A0ABW2LUQ0_9FLAO